jgi:uncharacterized protein (TIGR00369 family)
VSENKRRRGIDLVPHNQALGIETVEIERATALLKLPYDVKLIGNPDTGTIHGGAITALLDAASGTSVFTALTEWAPIATLDLRIDYMRAAEPNRDVLCRARCYKVTRNVAFTRAVAYHDSEDDPIAAAAGTFMLHTKAGSK